METEEFFKVSPPSCLSDLDSVLNELGMLATTTNSRCEYINELKVNMVSIEKRFLNSGHKGVLKSCEVSPRSFKSKILAKRQYKPSYNPYELPLTRHRTKSENNDTDNATNLARVVVEECISESLVEINQLKKAKSLESIIAACSENENGLLDLKNINFQNCFEVEKVSDSIQNLKVNE